MELCIFLLYVEQFEYFRWFFLIIYILSEHMPSFLLILMQLFRKCVRLHPSCVQWFGFPEITYVESINFPFYKVFNFEIEPMEMAFRVAVYSHEQIVLELSYLLKDQLYLEHAI